MDKAAKIIDNLCAGIAEIYSTVKNKISVQGFANLAIAFCMSVGLSKISSEIFVTKWIKTAIKEGILIK